MEPPASPPALPAHSVAEAHLYLMVTPCRLCGTGRTRCEGTRLDEPAGDEGQSRFTLVTRCESCGFDSEFRFEVPSAPAPEPADEFQPVRINPTASPSRLIDAVQWVTLFRIITEAAATQAEKAESRRLGYEAAQCLEEALKFYREDNDLPPQDALFHERTRQQVREKPELYARARLIGLRARLPALGEMEKRMGSGGAPRARRWWKLW